MTRAAGISGIDSKPMSPLSRRGRRFRFGVPSLGLLLSMEVLVSTSCGGNSEYRIEKFPLSDGAILIEESWVDGPGFCFVDCDVFRQTKLTLKRRYRNWRDLFARTETVFAWSQRAHLSVPSSAGKVARLVRAGNSEILVFGDQLFALRPVHDGEHRWTMVGPDAETKYFLRNFECCERSSCPECVTDEPYPKVPYPIITFDENVPVGRRSRTDAPAGSPSVLVYSLPDGVHWQFDFQSTVRENPGMRYHRVPRGLLVEVRVLTWPDRAGPGRGSFTGPSAVEAWHPRPRVDLQHTYIASDGGWTTVSIPCGSRMFSYEFSLPYADPDPNLMTLYIRRTGESRQDADFVRLGQWVNYSGTGCLITENGRQVRRAVAGFLRIVRG